MLRTWSLLLILFLLVPVFTLYSQEEEPGEDTPEIPQIDTWDDYEASRYVSGDKIFEFSLGLLFPVVFSGNIQNNLTLGGTGSLSFSYFLTPGIFVGGELNGSFSFTRAKNTLYMVPFGLRVGYQFVIWRFEIPLSFMIGGVPQKYGEKNYFGLFMKPGVALFWRFNPEWSFGLKTHWWFVPQWPKNDHKVLGNFVDLSISARYHF